jgi:hypothetical protein
MGRAISQERIEKIRGLLLDRYPSLHLYAETNVWFIRGAFPVKVEGQTIDHYLIEIWLPPDYPKSVPLLKELGKRIPLDPDNHVYPNGFLCVFLPDERWKYWPVGADIIAFLEGPVNDYFLSHTYHSKHNTWPFGERSHGKKGVVEYYAEELGTNNEVIIKRCLECLALKDPPKGHWRCFCGSGAKLRHCHMIKMIELRHKISPDTAKYTLTRYFQG